MTFYRFFVSAFLFFVLMVSFAFNYSFASATIYCPNEGIVTKWVKEKDGTVCVVDKFKFKKGIVLPDPDKNEFYTFKCIKNEKVK